MMMANLSKVERNEKPQTLMDLVNEFILQETMADRGRSTKLENLFSEENLSKIDLHNAINKLNNYGHTALSTAVFAGSLRCSKILLKLGADPNVRDTDGWTSLHFAIARSYFGIARYLISSGADTNLMNNDGESPMDFIESKELKKMLLSSKETETSLKRTRSLPTPVGCYTSRT